MKPNIVGERINKDDSPHIIVFRYIIMYYALYHHGRQTTRKANRLTTFPAKIDFYSLCLLAPAIRMVHDKDRILYFIYQNNRVYSIKYRYMSYSGRNLISHVESESLLFIRLMGLIKNIIILCFCLFLKLTKRKNKYLTKNIKQRKVTINSDTLY